MAILVDRDCIGIFGKMNTGKSSIMNLITQHATSITDPTPGTTADTKVALMEIHGIGPVKLYDTAGADEESVLGDKKRQKIFEDLKECDLVLLVIDPSVKECNTERMILTRARELDKQILVVYNIFRPKDRQGIHRIEKELPVLVFHKRISIVAIQPGYRPGLISFIKRNYEPRNRPLPLLPCIHKDEYYLLIIPMDVETPPGRYLRPQAMVEEYITRNWAYPVSFRLDLGKARSPDCREADSEKERFVSFLNGFRKRPQLIITDSQAMDVMNQWCPDDIDLTTFSIVMIQYMSRGRLSAFVKGLEVIGSLKKGDRVLIAEGCNHSRICEDIGTVQIPNYLQKANPGIKIEYNFGRTFSGNDKLQKYKLIIHCGACMISPQKLTARIRDLETIGVPFTNYGLVLSYKQGRDALDRVLVPWSINSSNC